MCEGSFEPYYPQDGGNPTSCICPSLGYTLTPDGTCLDCTPFDPLAITCDSNGTIYSCGQNSGFYPEVDAIGKSICACRRQGDDNGPQLKTDAYTWQASPENGVCDNSTYLDCEPGFKLSGNGCIAA